MKAEIKELVEVSSERMAILREMYPTGLDESLRCSPILLTMPLSELRAARDRSRRRDKNMELFLAFLKSDDYKNALRAFVEKSSNYTLEAIPDRAAA
jgi:hypothetical protein